MKKKNVPSSPLAILQGKSSEKKDEKEKPKGQKYSETHIKHHGDGSHTVRHMPMDKVEPTGGSGEVSYARPDLSGVIAGLKQHLAEEQAEGEK